MGEERRKWVKLFLITREKLLHLQIDLKFQLKCFTNPFGNRWKSFNLLSWEKFFVEFLPFFLERFLWILLKTK